MFVELVDSLRCIRPHEPAWLIAAAFETVGRDIVRGVLGCHICHAEYPIAHGVADFRGAASATERMTSFHASGQAADAPDPAAALRIAALLDLAEPSGYIVLAGSWSAASHELLALVDGVQVLGLNAVPSIESGGGVSLALVCDDVPVRAGSCRGIALDGANASPAMLASAVPALRAGARLVAPAATTAPDGVRVLARDESHWVGVKEAERRPVVPLALGRTTRR